MSGIQMGLMGSASFLGTVSIDDRSPLNIVADPAAAVATYTLFSSAGVFVTGDPGVPDWLSIPANTGLFEVRMTQNSGTAVSGPIAGTWFPLNVNRSWSLNQNSIGTSSSNITIEIRLASTLVVQDSASISFTATVEP